MLLKTPRKYIGSDMEGVTGVLNLGSIILPIILFIGLVIHATAADFIMSMVLSFGFVLALLIRTLFLRGYLNQAVMSVSVFFAVLLTMICSVGYGIHDITIIGFPIIIGFSSILLNEKQLILASLLTISGLVWLVVGERFGMIDPGQVPPGNTADFVLASSMIALGGVVAFSLTTNMKESLGGVNQQILVSKKEAQKLITEVQHKEEIIKEIHQAVINSLQQLELIIDNQAEVDHTLIETYKSLERKILVIKCAHEILLKDRSPLEIDLAQFTKILLQKIKTNNHSYMLDVSIEGKAYRTGVDQAIYFGICALELIQKLSEKGSSLIKVELTIAEKVVLNIEGNKNVEIIDGDMIIDLLVQQLKSGLSVDGGTIRLSLETNVS